MISKVLSVVSHSTHSLFYSIRLSSQVLQLLSAVPKQVKQDAWHSISSDELHSPSQDWQFSPSVTWVPLRQESKQVDPSVYI